MKKSDLSSVWKFEPDIVNSFGENLLQTLEFSRRMYGLINMLPSNFKVFGGCYYQQILFKSNKLIARS